MSAQHASPRATRRAQAARRRLDWAAERLLQSHRPYRARRFTARERTVELAAAAAFATLATALPLIAASDRALPVAGALALAAAFGLASRIELYVGAGSALPTQLVLVPMLFLLPAPLVPALVAAALAGMTLVDVARRRAHPERAISAVADAWHALGPATVIVLAGEPAPDAVVPLVLAAALAAQFATDIVPALVRESLGRGIAPTLQARVIATVYAIDACLTPVAVAATAAASGAFSVLAALVPLLGLLALLASDRRERIEEALSQLDELRLQRERLDAAIRRVGDAWASKLDREALVDLMLRSAVEALDAASCRVTLGGAELRWQADDAAGPGLDAAGRSAIAWLQGKAGLHTARVGSAHALAHTLPTGHAGDVLVVAREGRAFSEEERGLLTYLAGQVAVAMANVALHERLHREATVDPLTGLANHRRFREVLDQETQRTHRFRRPLALLMIDVDHFKAVNDTHGHQAGDAVLQAVAAAVAGTSRASDTAARYGGEELAVVLPETDLDGALAAGEAIRSAIEGLVVPVDGAQLSVTVSVGVAATVAGGPDELIAEADAALYAAKHAGRNRTAGARAQHVS